MATPIRASQGAHPVHTETNHGTDKKGRKIIMTHTRNPIWVALCALIPVLALMGCGDNTGSKETLSVAKLNVVATCPDCTSDSPVKPDFSKEGLTLTLIAFDQAEDKLSPDVRTKEIELSFDSEGEASGSAELPALGDFHLSMAGLDPDYKIVSINGFPTTALVVDMGQGVNELTMVIDNSDSMDPGKGNVTFKAEYPKGTTLTDCDYDFNGNDLDATCTTENGVSECNAIPVGGYTVDVSCGNGTLVRKGYGFSVLKDQTTAYTVQVEPVADTDGGIPEAGPGTAQACVTMVDGYGTALTDTDGCVYKVGGKVYEPVVPDGDAGSDAGETDAGTDADTDAGTDDTCEGTSLEGIPVHGTISAPLCIVCGVWEGCEPGVIFNEGETSPVEVTMTDTSIVPDSGVVTPDPTTVCLTVKMTTGDPINLAHCEVTDIAWKKLTPSTPPAGVTCDDTDSLFFTGVKDGDRQYHVVCDEGSQIGFYKIVANALNRKDMTFAPTSTPGDPCYKDIGDNVNINRMTLRTQIKLGHFNTAGSCIVESNASKFADWSVDDITDNGDCAGIGDPNCLIDVAGGASDPLIVGEFYPHLVLETSAAQLATLAPDEKVYHYVTITDPDAKTFVMIVVVKNGTVTEDADY